MICTKRGGKNISKNVLVKIGPYLPIRKLHIGKVLWNQPPITIIRCHIFKNGPFTAPFSLFSSFDRADSIVKYKFCWLLVSNCRPLVSEVTALATEPQPLPSLPYLTKEFWWINSILSALPCLKTWRSAGFERWSQLHAYHCATLVSFALVWVVQRGSTVFLVTVWKILSASFWSSFFETRNKFKGYFGGKKIWVQLWFYF